MTDQEPHKPEQVEGNGTRWLITMIAIKVVFLAVLGLATFLMLRGI